MIEVDLIIKNARLFQDNKYTDNIIVIINNSKFLKVLDNSQLNELAKFNAKETIDAKGCLLTTGLIDCHTHLIYGGERSHEFEWRLNGETYQSIAKKGGGIKSTVKATRAASFEQLYLSARARLVSMIEQGCLNFEIKSGYGLDLETECRMLRVAKKLEQDLGVNISKTYLGAHTVPLEYIGRADAYIDFICQEVLPQIAQEQLADNVDVFCESIGFNLGQTERVLEAAISLGFNIKCHAEQLSNLGASQMSAKKGAISCDHLEFSDEFAIKAMQKNDTVAVLLPGAFYFLKEKQKPPVELLRKYKVPIAIATDHNPGSSPTTSLPLIMNMACILFGLTVDEAWQAVTINAAKALAITMPTIEEGAVASFVIWPFSKTVDLIYNFGQIRKPMVFIKGKKQIFEELFF